MKPKTQQDNTQPNFMETLDVKQQKLLHVLRNACKKIAPVWPLENFVAVNPYLGLTHKNFEYVAKDLAALGGIQMTLPSSFYLEKIKSGEILHEDIEKVLCKKHSNLDVAGFLKLVEENHGISEDLTLITTFTDVATALTNKDWGRFMIGRISAWAASYFDKGQAVWSAAKQDDSLFVAWKFEASLDLAPQLNGLKGFGKKVSALPDHPIEAIQLALEKLRMHDKGLSLYLHRLLLRVGGWSAYAAQLDWENNLYHGKDGKLIEFLAVLICWEACLLDTLEHPQLDYEWNSALQNLLMDEVSQKMNPQIANNLILQEAFDLSAQRKITHKFLRQNNGNAKPAVQTIAQAIFCIDVRSEVYRRNLELVDPKIATLGFAGFFGVPVKYVSLGHKSGEAQCPVLLKTGPTIMEELADEKQTQLARDGRILNQQVSQVWKSFKSGAISCFGFVSPMGLTFLPKIFTDSYGLTRPVPHPDKFGLSEQNYKNRTIRLNTIKNKQVEVGIELGKQIEMAKNALTAMSLTSNFAKFVLLVGHGSTSVNNPHATGLDCGACGGHTGEANAKVATAILNNPIVRKGLEVFDIYIPSTTTFLACLHDTTTDEVKIFNSNEVPENQQSALLELEKSLILASKAARTERSLRMISNKEVNVDVIGRSKDWSQVRPEWGLAGCSAFVVAPRERTLDVDLEGKAFLHSYHWQSDKNFEVLEAIMTAPMVVTSWINLQYYASTVDNKNFGSGNKALHNITAGLGVLEGYSGDLRIGLPWQSVHDGKQFQHEPLKLNVIIEAPIHAINNVLEKHRNVKELCDNNWLQLLIMDEEGEISHRYEGDLIWEELYVKAS